MIRIKSQLLLCVLLLAGLNLCGMKRSAEQAAVAYDRELPSVFRGLPQDLWSKIFSYALLRYFCTVSKDMYAYFCYKNHLSDAGTNKENWRYLCANHPEFIVTNKYDCQRLYYLLIEEDNCALMECLLKADEHREQNLAELVFRCFSQPLESVVSNTMKELLYQYCQSRNRKNEWCLECSKFRIGQPSREDITKSFEYANFRDGFGSTRDIKTGCYLCYDGAIQGEDAFLSRAQRELIKGVMTGDVGGITTNRWVRNAVEAMVPEEERFYYRETPTLLDNTVKIRVYLSYFCSEAMWDSLIDLLWSVKGSRVICDQLYRAAELNDITMVAYFLKKGVDPNYDKKELIYDPQLITIAVHQVIKNNDYRLLNLLVGYRPEVNIHLRPLTYTMYISCLPKEAERKILAHFGKQAIQELLRGDLSFLLTAVVNDRPELVRILLECGAKVYGPQSFDDESDLCLSNGLGTDLLEIAKALGNEKIITMIEQAQSRVKAQQDDHSDSDSGDLSNDEQEDFLSGADDLSD